MALMMMMSNILAWSPKLSILIDLTTDYADDDLTVMMTKTNFLSRITRFCIVVDIDRTFR